MDLSLPRLFGRRGTQSRKFVSQYGRKVNDQQNLEPQTYRGLCGSCRFECLLNGSVGVAGSKGPIRRVDGLRPGYGKRPEGDFRWHGVFGQCHHDCRRQQRHCEISKLGRVELAPNSSLRLSFSRYEASAGLLESGSAHVSTLAGILGQLHHQRWHGGSRRQQSTSFTVNIVTRQYFRIDSVGCCRASQLATPSSRSPPVRAPQLERRRPLPADDEDVRRRQTLAHCCWLWRRSGSDPLCRIPQQRY